MTKIAGFKDPNPLANLFEKIDQLSEMTSALLKKL